MKYWGKRGHIIYHGDCLNELNKLNHSVDLIVTDPPYNRGLKYGKIFNDKKKLPEYVEWLKERLRICEKVLKKNGSMYIISYPELNARIFSYLVDELKLNLKRWIIWNYPTNIGHSKKNWTRSHRSILFLTKGKKYTFNRQNIIQRYKNPEVKKVRKRIENGSKGRNAYDSLRFLDLIEMQKGMIDVHEINLCKNVTKTRQKGHPCQLPFQLIEILIKVSSNKGDVVLDPFAGTFSTCVVAKQLNRKSIGIDIMKKYCNIGKKRLKG